VVDNIGSIVVDSSPLIYLAKLGALDVFELAALRGLLPAAVVSEVATPALEYLHPDAAAIGEAIRNGALTVIGLTATEAKAAESLRAQQSGLGRGEAQVIAVAAARGLRAVIADHRGRTVAGLLDVQLVDTVELLFAGTTNRQLLSDRIRQFAGLVNMRLADYEALRQRIERRRLR
jgi:predicted nucleic acid-binding protein